LKNFVGNSIFQKVKYIKAMQNNQKIQNQIKALNKQLEEGKVKNVFPVQNKIKSLKNALKIENERQTWANLLNN
jgi:hypothetical protein